MLAELAETEIHLIPFLIEDRKILIAQILGLALLILLLWRINIPVFSLPFWRDLLGTRMERITKNHDQVEIALADVRQLHDDYAARLASIEVEAKERIDAAVREAEAVHGEIIAEAKQSAALIRRRSEEEIARERARQRVLLRRQLVQTTFDAAETSVLAHNGEKVQRSLISDFITGIADAQNGAAVPFASAASATTVPTTEQA